MLGVDTNLSRRCLVQRAISKFEHGLHELPVIPWCGSPICDGGFYRIVLSVGPSTKLLVRSSSGKVVCTVQLVVSTSTAQVPDQTLLV